MKYYLIEISNGDTRISGKAIYEYETENEAIASYHQKLATAMKSDLYTDDLVMVIDENGKVLKREKYVKPVEPEAAEESSETPETVE